MRVEKGCNFIKIEFLYIVFVCVCVCAYGVLPKQTKLYNISPVLGVKKDLAGLKKPNRSLDDHRSTANTCQSPKKSAIQVVSVWGGGG